MPDLPWSDVEPLPLLNGDLDSILESVQALQRAWKDVVSLNDAAFQEARRRSLRRHAIETGIIERLYEVDWGVTEALVAEGLTADAVARAADGVVSEDVLDIIRSQYDALEFLVEAARDGREVSTSLIRELHVALTRRQRTYTATGPTGQTFEATLHHGQWKVQANHVRRPDGSMLEYTPPEHVPAQMDELIRQYRTTESVHPLVREAWLHHRFVRIHPFEDGNGRVARCLTLLGLLKCDLAPLVVDRRERDRYLRCLDQANEGELRPLVRFFAGLEIVALRSELERPPKSLEEAGAAGGALAVLGAGVDRLRGLRDETGARERASKVQVLADALQQRLTDWLQSMADQFESLLKDIDSGAFASVKAVAPPQPQARFWRWQVVQAARSVDFYANLQQGVWWTRLRLVALGQELRFLVFLQKVGRGETGVLALTVYAEMLGRESGDTFRQEAEPVVVSTPSETVTWIHTDSPESRWDSVEEVLDTTLAAALHTFTSALG
ncbi:Fic family protein [Streptomyces aidingensis]|uniref:Fic/DOC family protein n=1 Tax=Streptomyces aidingensis TaxID=910347 RepID=A0A1I1F2P9_9ACTN|nr:Fic family protein [Streptomyces aidingensis]SFB93604.1 Fic/DOC family protein [Streptomyces aidingensis]